MIRSEVTVQLAQVTYVYEDRERFVTSANLSLLLVSARINTHYSNLNLDSLKIFLPMAKDCELYILHLSVSAAVEVLFNTVLNFCFNTVLIRILKLSLIVLYLVQAKAKLCHRIYEKEGSNNFYFMLIVMLYALKGRFLWRN